MISEDGDHWYGLEIDTDGYLGHTPAPWGSTRKAPWTVVARHEEVPDKYYGSKNTHPDMQLIYDAPLLLAEFKRLRYHLQKAEELLEHWNENGEGEYYWDGEEYRFRYEGEE
tara:strand:+ start:7070 stop:7405 length:336 start_codon:yes stop_codon:yes gene_type:complete